MIDEKNPQTEQTEQTAPPAAEQPASPQPEAAEAAGAAGQAEDQPPRDIQAELAAAKAQAEAAAAAAAQAKDQLLRTAAEYENYRKRSAREQDAAFGNGVSHAVGKILTILDTLEMAANAPTTDEAYKKGVLMTLEKANAAFAALQVEEIPALGLAFDPEVHNAVMQQPAPDGQESGTVLQVFQKGYKLGDKVIRHATVIVAE